MATVGASDQVESSMVRNGRNLSLDGSREHHGVGEPFLFTSESVGEGHPGKSPKELDSFPTSNSVKPQEFDLEWRGFLVNVQVPSTESGKMLHIHTETFWEW